MINTRPFPWIKLVIRIFNHIHLSSDHQANSSDKQLKSCQNLVKALLNIYQSSSSPPPSSIQNKHQRVKEFFCFKKKTNFIL